jgi:hypothetical protein
MWCKFGHEAPKNLGSTNSLVLRRVVGVWGDAQPGGSSSGRWRGERRERERKEREARERENMGYEPFNLRGPMVH